MGRVSTKLSSEPHGEIKSKSDEQDQIWFDGVDKKLIEIHCKKRKLEDGNEKNLTTKANQIKPLPSTSKNGHQRPSDYTSETKEVAIDCEMVECNFNRSVLARVSIVNLYGHPLLDTYVSAPSKVTDYRTKYSGIRKTDLMGAPEFEIVQADVKKMLKGKIVVGHALHNDFQVLKLTHPKEDIRDTSKYFRSYFLGKTPSLKKLSESMLGISVQTGEHDSIQDAQAAMKLYVMHRDKWNQTLTCQNRAVAKRKSKKKTKTFYTMKTN